MLSSTTRRGASTISPPLLVSATTRSAAVPLIGGDRDAGPLDRRVMPRQISEHVAAALRILASDDDPGFVGIRSSPATFFELAELITLAQLIACPEREARADAHAEFAEGELRVSRQ